MDVAVGPVAPIAGRPGRIARNTSMATRLALAVLFVALAALLATSLVAIDTGQSLAEDLGRDRMVAIGSSRGEQAERYLRSVIDRTVALGSSPMTAEALGELSAATAELEQLGEAEVAEAEAAVERYHGEQVVPRLERMRAQPVATRDLVPTNPAALHLQHHYLAASPSPGEEASVDDAGDGSVWTEVHERIHPTYRETAEGLGIDDLYLVDADATVVYTVAKGIELGTELDIGPLSGSTLATLVRRVAATAEPGSIAVADLAPYAGAGDAPVGFLATPVVDGGRPIGVLAVQVPTAELTRIVTGDGNWDEVALGETGEVFLAGRDQRLRTEARRFLEAPDRYLEDALAAGSITEDDRRRIDVSGTSVFFQRVAGAPLTAAEIGDGTDDGQDYVGEDGRVVVAPLEVEEFDWFVVTAVTTAQLEAGTDDYVTDLVIGIAVFVVVLTFLAVAWANRTVEPIRAISRRLRLAQGIETRGRVEVPAGASREFVALADDFGDMAGALAARRAEVVTAHDERRRFIERFLPPSVARRVEDGDRQIIDQVPNATVVVLVVGGLAALVADGTDRSMLDDTIDEADRLASAHGLERVKLSANTYVAACGISRPYLDQAPRALAFAAEAVEAAGALGDGARDGLAVSVGIDTGPVTYGLAGPNRLVYDAWGPTVATAARLAQLAAPGSIVVSSSTRDQLPERTAVDRLDADRDAWLVEPAAHGATRPDDSADGVTGTDGTDGTVSTTGTDGTDAATATDRADGPGRADR